MVTLYHPLMFLRTKILPMKPPIIGVTVNIIIQGMLNLPMIKNIRIL